MLRAVTAAPAVDQLTKPTLPALHDDVPPFVTGSGVQLAHFDYDIPALYAGTPPSELVRGPRILGFVPSSDGAYGVAFVLSTAMEHMVDRARSGATLDDIVAAAATAIGVQPHNPGFREACLRGAKNLLERGLLLTAD